MVGGLGNDTYHVDIGTDVVVEAAGGGTDTVFASVLDTLGAKVENLNLLGNGNFGGNGNRLANVITGNRSPTGTGFAVLAAPVLFRPLPLAETPSSRGLGWGASFA